MTPFEEWCRAVELEADHVGDIALSNLRYDAIEGRVDRPIRAAFRQRVEQLFGTRKDVPPHFLIQVVAREQPDTYFCQGPKPMFHQCSRVVPALDFVHENINLKARGWHVEDFVPEGYLDELEVGLEGMTKNSIPADPTRYFAWVTRTAEIGRLRDTMPGDQIAIETRNRCGLLHHGAAVPILFVEVEYPEAGIGTTLHAPTFLEGAPYQVYVSKSGDGKWGIALDLAQIADGMSEAVHRRIDFTGHFKMRRLGWVAGTISVEHRKIMANMPKAWGRDYNELESLFQ